MSKINITINNEPCTANPGQTILEAATDNGIEIPNLCSDPRLKPVGACRLCLVCVDGFKGPCTACTTTVQPEMVIHTETEEVLTDSSSMDQFEDDLGSLYWR